MSKEKVEQFFNKIGEEDALQQRLVSILQSDVDYSQEVSKLAQEYGFDITAEQLSEEVKKRQEEFSQRQEAGELSEEELEAVAGGLSLPGSFTFPLPFPNPIPFPKPGPFPFPKKPW